MLSFASKWTSTKPRGHLLCIGHSHVACVAAAARASDIPLTALNFWEMPGAIENHNGTLRLSRVVIDQLGQHDGPVFCMAGGSAYSVLGMLVHPRRFDFFLPSDPTLTLDQNAEVLPALAVRRTLETMTDEYLRVMSAIRHACRGPFFHLEPPPPYFDSQRIYEDIPWAMYPEMTREISPAMLRLKLWKMHSDILLDWCAVNDASFVACPEDALDHSGFIRERYYGDGAHANAAYGALVLAQMRSLA